MNQQANIATKLLCCPPHPEDGSKHTIESAVKTAKQILDQCEEKYETSFTAYVYPPDKPEKSWEEKFASFCLHLHAGSSPEVARKLAGMDETPKPSPHPDSPTSTPSQTEPSSSQSQTTMEDTNTDPQPHVSAIFAACSHIEASLEFPNVKAIFKHLNQICAHTKQLQALV